MNELMRLKATNGTVIAYEDRVIISRKGLAAFATQGGFQGDRTIFYKDLSSIEYKKPGWTNGYIQFIFPGTENTSARVGILGSSSESAKDQNTVILRAFNKKIPIESEELYKLLLRKIEEYKSVSGQGVALVSNADELKKYAELKEKGIITQEEFDAKKRHLLE